MVVSIEVVKNQNENAVNLIRRFSRKVKGSGIVQKVRNNRFFERPKSHHKVKARALNTMRKRSEYARLQKLGKAPER